MEREKLESMKGSELIAYADKLGVKVSCNKERTSLKESKAKVIDKIISFETEHATKEEKVERHLVPMSGIEKLENLRKEYSVKNEIHKNNKTSNQELENRISLVTEALKTAGYIVRPYKSNNNFLTVLLYGQKKAYAEVDLNKKFITVYRKTQANNTYNFAIERKVNFSYKFSYKLEYCGNYLDNILKVLE